MQPATILCGTADADYCVCYSARQAQLARDIPFAARCVRYGGGGDDVTEMRFLACVCVCMVWFGFSLMLSRKGKK